MDKITVVQYTYVVLLIVFTTFEYFFRSSLLINLLNCVAIIHFAVFYLGKIDLKKFLLSNIFVLAVSLVFILQVFFIKERINNFIGFVVGAFGAISIACILKDKLVIVLSRVILFISAYSLLIYLLCLIPFIDDFLFSFCDYFPSLSLEKAVNEGGGKNIVIYNFFVHSASQLVGVSRNCGPFWEPGMFAFFINLVLFFELFLVRHSFRYLSIVVLLSALVTTFSTGGYISGLVLLTTYLFLKHKSIWGWVVLLPIGLSVVYSVFQLDYVGGKLSNQYENATYGSDASRFGAFITQVKMIEDSPLIGGQDISDYASSKTLASGTLVPFVEYGLPVGILYFVLLYLASVNISKLHGKTSTIGLFLFLFIVLLSFSQTILLSKIVLLLFFYGLDLTFKKSGYIKSMLIN